MSGGYEIAIWILLVIASVTDLLWGKIYNSITFSFLGVGFAMRFWIEGSEGALNSLLAVGAAFALFFPLWRFGVIKAGDCKLLMAVGVWTSWRLVVDLAVLTILIGSIVGAFILIRSRGLLGSTKSLAEHVSNSKPARSLKIEFAPAFLCAYFFISVGSSRGWSWL